MFTIPPNGMPLSFVLWPNKSRTRASWCDGEAREVVGDEKGDVFVFLDGWLKFGYFGGKGGLSI